VHDLTRPQSFSESTYRTKQVLLSILENDLQKALLAASKHASKQVETTVANWSTSERYQV